MYTIDLTKSQVENLIEFFEVNFIRSVREDDGIDNMAYIVDMCHIYTKLKNAKEKSDGKN